MTAVFAAALVAATWNARVTITGFVIFILASIAWMIDGWLENKSRWLPKAEKELKS